MSELLKPLDIREQIAQILETRVRRDSTNVVMAVDCEGVLTPDLSEFELIHFNKARYTASVLRALRAVVHATDRKLQGVNSGGRFFVTSMSDVFAASPWQSGSIQQRVAEETRFSAYQLTPKIAPDDPFHVQWLDPSDFRSNGIPIEPEQSERLDLVAIGNNSESISTYLAQMGKRLANPHAHGLPVLLKTWKIEPGARVYGDGHEEGIEKQVLAKLLAGLTSEPTPLASYGRDNEPISTGTVYGLNHQIYENQSSAITGMEVAVRRSKRLGD